MTVPSVVVATTGTTGGSGGTSGTSAKLVGAAVCTDSSPSPVEPPDGGCGRLAGDAAAGTSSDWAGGCAVGWRDGDLGAPEESLLAPKVFAPHVGRSQKTGSSTQFPCRSPPMTIPGWNRGQATGLNIGTGGCPSSVGLKTTSTFCPMRTSSRSQSTMFVIMVVPSSSVT